MSSEPTISTSAEREVLQCFLEMHSQYHNQKENMAFSILGLEGAFFIGLFVLSQWPQYLRDLATTRLAVLFGVVWILFHLALRYQLRNRRIAAILVASYYQALAQRSTLKYVHGEFTVYPELPLDTFIDMCVVPIRGKLRQTDVEPALLEDGEVVRPMSIKASCYHLAKHKAEASTSWTKYAYPIDLLTSFGSIFLLLVALARIFDRG